MQNSNETNLFDLKDWDIIQVYGKDSSVFLQNLLTIDVNKISASNPTSEMDAQEAKLGGFCSPQGRLIATFWISRCVINAVDTFFIWVSKDIAADLANQLKKFIFRSKVTIDYKENDFLILGETSKSENQPLINKAKYSIELPPVIHEGRLIFRRINAIEDDQTTELKNFVMADSIIWNLIEVESGIPRITKKTQEAFIPQMINIESLGAIDFKKGCYPGQEIVARSQYRGTIKRRLKIAKLKTNIDSDSLPMPGDEIYNIENLAQPAGMVVLSAKSKLNNEVILQIELKLEQVNAKLVINPNTYHEQAFLEIQDPPYPILEI